MGSYFSNTVISELTLDFVLLPVLDAVAHVISWLYSVVDVVDKCFDSMPRGPAGSSHGDFAEVEFTVNSGDTGSDGQPQGAGAKIRNSLKLVDMGSVSWAAGVSSSSSEHRGDAKGDHVCAVCLGEIRDDEKVYKLPQCDHIFHSACLDRWVGHNHHTCPLCRTSLVTGSSHCIGGITQDDQQQDVSTEQDPGLPLGIWFLSQYTANVNFDGRGWTRAVRQLTGF